MPSTVVRFSLRALALFAGVLLTGLLAGCGSSASSEPALERSGWDSVVAQPDGFEGRSAVGIVGKIFSLETDGDAYAIQMYTNGTFDDGNTLVGVSKANADSLEDGDFIKVDGTVGEAFEGENAFGASLTAPVIVADKVRVISALQAAPPAKATTKVQRSQTQSGVTLELQRVDRLDRGGRILLRVRNRSGYDANFYTFNTKLIQGGTQQEPESSYASNLPGFDGEIASGVNQEAVLGFKNMRPGGARLIVDWSSSNYSSSTVPFEFRFTIK